MFGSSKLFCADTLRIYTYGDVYENFSKDIIHTQDGGYLIVGSTYANNDRKSDVYVLKLDSNFKEVWSYAYGKNNIEWGTGVVETLTRNFLICGYTNSFGNGGYDAYVLCLDSLGHFLWEKSYGGANWDFFNDIISLKDGNYMLAGETYSFSNGQSDIYYVKIDEAGDTLWTQHYGFAGKEIAHELIQAHDSSIYITGEIDLLNTDSINAFLLRLDNNEQFSWFNTYGGNRTDIAYDLIESDDSTGLFLAGATSSALPPFNTIGNDLNQYLFKTDLTGQLLWQYAYGTSFDVNILPNKEDIYMSLIQKPNSYVAFAGYTKTYGGGEKDLTITYTDKDGYFKGGPTRGALRDEWFEKAIYANNRYVFLGNTTSWGQGNTDILIFTQVNIDDTASKFSFHQDTVTLPVHELVSKTSEFLVYPIPTNKYLNIVNNTHQNKVEIAIYDIMGQLVYSNFIFNESNIISLDHFKSGLYVLKMITPESSFQKTFIIQK